MMEFAWNPRVGWLAGAKGTVRPDVCFASWVESTPNGNLSQASEVRLHAQPLFPKARWQSLPGPWCPPPPAPGRPAGGRRAGHRAETAGPALRQTSAGPGSAQQQTVYRPGSGRTAHGRGTTSQPRPGNVALGLWQRLMLARLLLAHSRMAQAKANKTEANAKGLDLLSESDPGTRARSKGGARAGGWGGGGGGEDSLPAPHEGVGALRGPCGKGSSLQRPAAVHLVERKGGWCGEFPCVSRVCTCGQPVCAGFVCSHRSLHVSLQAVSSPLQ